jgi:hypothetical protein
MDSLLLPSFEQRLNTVISAAEQHAYSGFAFVGVGAVALEVLDLATSLASAAALGAKKSCGGANKA